MHEHLRNTALVLLIIAMFFAGDRGLAALMYHLLSYSSLPIAQLYAGGVEVDILILGDSRAYRHLHGPDIARDTGMRVLQLAQPGGSTRIAEAFLNDYLERSAPPQLVILEVSALAADDSLIGELRPFASRSPHLESILRDVYPRQYWASRLIHLYALNATMTLNALHKIVVPTSDLRLRGRISARELEIATAIGSSCYDFSIENEQALKRISQLTLERDIDLHLVVTPYLPGSRPALVSGLSWADHIRRLVGMDVPLWDYTKLSLSPKYFYDTVHLNSGGVTSLHERMAHDGVF